MVVVSGEVAQSPESEREGGRFRGDVRQSFSVCRRFVSRRLKGCLLRHLHCLSSSSPVFRPSDYTVVSSSSVRIFVFSFCP